MVAHGRINTGLNMLGKSPSLSTFMHRCLLTVAASPSCSRKWHISLLVRAPARRSQKILNALLALHGEDCGFKLDTAALLFYSTGSSIFPSSSRNIHLLYFLSMLELSTFVLRWGQKCLINIMFQRQTLRYCTFNAISYVSFIVSMDINTYWKLVSAEDSLTSNIYLHLQPLMEQSEILLLYFPTDATLT